MRALSIRTGWHVRKAVISTLAGTMLFGCAMERTPGLGRPAPGCRMNSVLYCDLTPSVDGCQCVRHSDLRDMMRTLSGR